MWTLVAAPTGSEAVPTGEERGRDTGCNGGWWWCDGWLTFLICKFGKIDTPARCVAVVDSDRTRITASQNSQSLIGLSDVGHTSDTVANGDFLLYDSSTSKFAFVDFASEVNAYADGRIAATNSNHVSFGSSISATRVLTASSGRSTTAVSIKRD